MKINYKFKEFPENWFKYLPKIQKKCQIRVAYSTINKLFVISLNDEEFNSNFMNLIAGSLEKGLNNVYYKLTTPFLEKLKSLDSLGYIEYRWSNTDYFGWAIDVYPETLSEKALELRKYLQS